MASNGLSFKESSLYPMFWLVSSTIPSLISLLGFCIHGSLSFLEIHFSFCDWLWKWGNGPFFFITIFEFSLDLKFGEPPTATKEPTKTTEMFNDEKLVTTNGTNISIGHSTKSSKPVKEVVAQKKVKDVDPPIASAMGFFYWYKISST